MSTNAKQISRRNFFSRAAVFGCATLLARENARSDDVQRAIGLGFSLYGMRSIQPGPSIDALAEIGYDCIEVPVIAGWLEVQDFDGRTRRSLIDRLARRKMRLTSLMDNLPLLGNDAQHQANLERLKSVAQIAQDLVHDGKKPLIETIMGGRPGEFEAVKDRLIMRLGDWAKVAEQAAVKLAIKAHTSNATQRPAQLLSLLDSVASPSLVAAYDYSHFQIQALNMKDTLDALLPRTAFIHVKDAVQTDGKWRFALPGEGTIDYVEMFKHLGQSNYQGDVMVEVSSQVSSKLSYDPLAAARQCYNHLSDAFSKAGLKRG